MSQSLVPPSRSAVDYNLKRERNGLERPGLWRNMERGNSPDYSIIDYELNYEREESERQVLWSKTMEKGDYKDSLAYKKVEVLLLCWAATCDDLITNDEVDKLKSVFEEQFKYHAQIAYLDADATLKLQVQVNAKVAAFVGAYDGPNTLLIVYYAGHGRPGSFYGSLELFGKISPNDKKKTLDCLVWNKTEDLLRPAEADVLEIFDCCYAGNLRLTRGEHKFKYFEYLAATKELSSTRVPGKDSFTSALIFALEALVKEKPGGRFTTVELLNKIKLDAPDFPKDQNPVLSDREGDTSAGRIMLHPLQKEEPNAQTSPKEPPSPDPAKRHSLTLHFDFEQKPPSAHIEKLGLELNSVFERNTFCVNGVRYGGMQSGGGTLFAFARAVKSFKAGLERRRRTSSKPQRPPMNFGIQPSDEWAIKNFSELPTPSSASTTQLSPRTQNMFTTVGVTINTPSLSPASLSSLPDSTEDAEGNIQTRRKRRRRSS